MFKRKISKIVKRDGSVVDFNLNKIASAMAKAAVSVHQNPNTGNKLLDKIEKELFNKYKGKLPTVENIQDIIESVLIKNNYSKVAKAYILYREKRREIRETKNLVGVSNDELKLNINSVKILHNRYLLRNHDGEIIETPIQMFRRVAKVIAGVERKYEKDESYYENEFFKIMSNLEFLPNSPCLMNAGTRLQQLSACFVLEVPDSLNGIFDTLKTAALIQKTGGGTGFSFSNLRHKGAIIDSTKGITSGPVSFIELYDKMTDVIKQGSKRRGANMAVLRFDHPDILEFISCKRNSFSFENFNISVAVTDKFMDLVSSNGLIELVDPRNCNVIKKVKAKFIFDEIIENAWENGDPGIIFLDRINNLESSGKIISATNPCGEQPLLNNESCVLGSINLVKFVKSKEVDWEKLKNVVHLGVRFLDNVIDANDYVNNEIKEMSLNYRRIGLGVMGFADMLILLGISYDSVKALKFAERLMKFITKEARSASSKLALEKGDFPKFNESKLYKKYKHARNVSVTTIAPTGTISLIADSVSSGIEPLFAVSYVREILEGTRLFEINSLFEETIRKRGIYSSELIHKISKLGSLHNIEEIPKDVKKLFVTAFDIKPEWHVKMQAAFQKYVENGVSKTVNLSENATIEDVKKVYLLAHKLGCKGITVFRYRCKDGKQVLYLHNDFVKVSSEYSGGHPCNDCLN